MKNRYEKIRNIGIIYRQARQRANNLCRREFYPFYNRIKVPDIVDKILKLKNSSVYVEDMPGVYLDRIIKYLCVVTDDKNVFYILTVRRKTVFTQPPTLPTAMFLYIIVRSCRFQAIFVFPANM